MPLTEDQKQYIQNNLAKFDEALLDKPMLATIYDGIWRQKLRNKLLAVDSCNDITYPGAYSAPLFESLGQFPSCYQYRLEEGAVILLSKLSKKEKNHLIKRLRDGCPSAEEELLLARGFSIEFGKDAIVKPESNQSQVRPEFIVRVNNLEFAIEAKGLLDSLYVRLLWQGARLVGQNFWVSYDTTVKDLKRVEREIEKKIKQVDAAGIGIIVFTQYTAWPAVTQTIDLLRQLALEPKVCNLLAIAYVFNRLIQGFWFSSSVMKSSNIDKDLCERLRRAIMNSFYPRPDGLLF